MDRSRVYKVQIDGQVQDELWPNQTKTFWVAPGPHKVQVKIDFLKSNELSVTVEGGETVELLCKGHGSAMALFNTLFRRNAYLDLLLAPSALGGEND